VKKYSTMGRVTASQFWLSCDLNVFPVPSRTISMNHLFKDDAPLAIEVLRL